MCRRGRCSTLLQYSCRLCRPRTDITSGDQFGITDQRIADIRRQLSPDLMEMESGSVAQVCWYLGIPFLCIRGGSNLTQGSPDDDYRKLSPFASRQAAQFTVSLVAELARSSQ